jgi:hypothetical protein
LLLHKELRQRLATEYRYAATKMQESPDASKKLFYFSVFFGEAQRVLNWQWVRDIALIHMVTRQVHAQITHTDPSPAPVLPIKWATVFEHLTQTASDLATYMEKTGNEDSEEELCQILGRFAEIAYLVSGNGSYLYEKGIIKL